ncbi:MAG: hypothetical protein KDD04_11580, partial [Sinomicrobium sp.]|nr:hypothetical protein [Sinomicrobium sp.]
MEQTLLPGVKKGKFAISKKERAMNPSSKLKPNLFMIITLILIGGGLLLVQFFSETGIIEKKSAWFVMFAVYLHATLENGFLLLKTGNKGFLAPAMLYLVVSAIGLSLLLEQQSYIDVLMILALFLALGVIYVSFIGKQTRIRSRFILEMAAQRVAETDAGFTPRPYPAGKLSYSREELAAFTGFMMKHLIAMRYREANGTYLVVEAGGLRFARFFKPDFSKVTHVQFDDAGAVSVNISRKDYQQYRDTFNFDQLCQALGNLFIV